MGDSKKAVSKKVVSKDANSKSFTSEDSSGSGNGPDLPGCVPIIEGESVINTWNTWNTRSSSSNGNGGGSSYSTPTPNSNTVPNYSTNPETHEGFLAGIFTVKDIRHAAKRALQRAGLPTFQFAECD